MIQKAKAMLPLQFRSLHALPWFYRVLFAVVLVYQFSSLASAQRIVDEQGLRIAAGLELPRNKSGEPIPAWVACGDYFSLTGPSAQSQRTRHGFKFMEAALLIQKVTNAKDGLTYALLGTSTNGETASEYRGWVDTRYLLEQDTGERLPTGVMRKCMLVNRLTVLLKDKPGAKSSPDLVPVTLKPDVNAATSESFRLNNIFFVFRALDDFVLIGTAERFNFGLEKEVVKGWVPLSRVSSWDTALALEWDHETASQRNAPGLIVNDKRTALKLIKPEMSELKETDSSVLFIESLKDGTTKRLKKGDKRYPILDKTQAGDLLQQSADLNPENRLLRVGVFGQYTGEVDATKLKNNLNKVITNSANIDILFVVDDSEGMEATFSQVASSVGQITELFRPATQATGDSRREVRVAVSYYGDKEWTKDPFKAGTWVSIRSSAEIELLCEEIKNHRQSPGGDDAEDVLEGIRMAIDSAKFPRFGRRIVFVIGDMGDKLYNPRIKGSKESVVFNESVDGLVKRLVPEVGEPIELYAIQIDSQLSKQPAYKWFEEQMKILISRANDRWKEKSGEAVEIGEFKRISQADKTDSIIKLQLLETVATKSKQAKQSTDELMSTSRVALAGNWPTSVSPAVRARLKSYGIAWQDLVNDRGFEVYEEGLVWTHAPQGGKKSVKQTRGMVLVDEQSVRDLQRACEIFVNHLGVTVGARRLDKAEFERLTNRIRSVLIRESGKNNEDLAAYFVDRSLPVRSRLFTSLSEAGVEGKALKQEEVVDIMIKSLRLKDIIDGKDRQWKIEVKKQTTGADILVPTAQLKDGREAVVDRWFSMDGDPNRLRYVYLDLEREIP